MLHPHPPPPPFLLPPQTLPEKEARAIIAQVFSALAYLNQPPRRVIHYDLKPANVLFDTTGLAKVRFLQRCVSFKASFPRISTLSLPLIVSNTLSHTHTMSLGPSSYLYLLPALPSPHMCPPPLQVTDFGLSKVVEEGGTMGMELTSQGAGTYWYLPPECFELSAQGQAPRISNKVRGVCVQAH
jgi:serine/threonine protein kinase